MKEYSMPAGDQSESVPVNADDLATLISYVIIEVVGALYPLESSPEQTLTDIANQILKAAETTRLLNRRAILSKIAARLIATEQSGLD
jgi:hypothetical protein